MLSDQEIRVLTALDFHAREGLTSLAKSCGMTKQLFEYHFKKLKQRGVLSGFYPIISSQLLGYVYGRIFIQCASITPDFEHRLNHYIQGNSQLFWAYQLQGNYDYILVYWAHSIDNFRHLVAEFLAQFGPTIVQRSEQIVSNVIHLSHRCFLHSAPYIRFDLKEPSGRTNLDSIDIKILSALATNGRASLIEIANECSESDKVVRYRLKRLEKRKIIAGYRPMIRYDLTGMIYRKVFIFLNRTLTSEMHKLEKRLLKHPYVLYLVYGIGIKGDLDFEMIAPTEQAFFDFLDELRRAYPKLILGFEHLSFKKLLKVNYFPFDKRDVPLLPG